jgi:hypothetical protein
VLAVAALIAWLLAATTAAWGRLRALVMAWARDRQAGR